MNRAERRQGSKLLAKANADYGQTLQDIPPSLAPPPPLFLKAMRSSEYLVQFYRVPSPLVRVRLSICRTRLDGQRWADGIDWETLQRLKSEAGFGDFDAVEVFPSDSDVVNVANMRHLWVLSEPAAFAWRVGNS